MLLDISLSDPGSKATCCTLCRFVACAAVKAIVAPGHCILLRAVLESRNEALAASYQIFQRVIISDIEIKADDVQVTRAHHS